MEGRSLPAIANLASIILSTLSWFPWKTIWYGTSLQLKERIDEGASWSLWHLYVMRIFFNHTKVDLLNKWGISYYTKCDTSIILKALALGLIMVDGKIKQCLSSILVPVSAGDLISADALTNTGRVMIAEALRKMTCCNLCIITTLLLSCLILLLLQMCYLLWKTYSSSVRFCMYVWNIITEKKKIVIIQCNC